MTPGLVLILGILSMGSAFATDTYIPALPEIARDLQTSPALAQATLSVFMIAQAIGTLVVGVLSDRWGRWIPLVASNVLFVAAGIGAALAPDIAFLLVMRAVQGVAAAAGPVIARAVVADIASGKQASRLFGVLMMIFGFAPIVAPLLGGPLTEWGGWRAPMWAIVALSALALTASLLLTESNPAARRALTPRTSPLTAYRSLFGNRVFLTAAAVNTASFGMVYVWLTTSSFVFQQEYGLSESQYSLAFGVISAGILTGGFGNGILLRAFTPRQILIGCGSVMAGLSALTLTLALAGALPVGVLIALAALTFGASAPVMANGTALGLEAVPAAQVGAASALMGAVEVAVPALIAPLIGAWGSDALTMLSASAGYALAALLLALSLVVARRRPAQR